MPPVQKKLRRFHAIIPVLVWTLIFVLPFLLRILLFRNDPREGSLVDIFFSFLTIIGIFYLHTWLVYPLLNRRWGKWLYAGALLGVAGLFLVSMNYFMHNVTRIALLFPFALIIFCSFSYRVYIEKIRQNERIREMETIQLKTELDFLRSQVSPHFMFNLMNTLVSMARKRSELMEPSLISLSQLMRYMLYDSSNEKIDLFREIEYLKNYISLQLLRFGDTVRFNLFLSGDPAGYAIEPMLLIPFVENAFKHGAEYVDEPMIDVVIDIDNKEGKLRLKVMNSISRVERRRNEGSGIGLVNVRRRLALLYPDHHSIFVEEKDDLYTLNLEINL